MNQGPPLSTGHSHLASLWEFSVQLYAKPGVADACLALQNRYGLDVNLVLFCLWYGRSCGELPHSQLDLALNVSLPWAANVVNPLRMTRCWIKQHRQDSTISFDELEKFRSKVKHLELEAERLQQNQLQQLVSASVGNSNEGSLDAAVKNLQSYLLRMEVENNEEIDSLLAAVIQQFPTVSGQGSTPDHP